MCRNPTLDQTEGRYLAPACAPAMAPHVQSWCPEIEEGMQLEGRDLPTGIWVPRVGLAHQLAAALE
jgi:hypothetical protein